MKGTKQLLRVCLTLTLMFLTPSFLKAVPPPVQAAAHGSSPVPSCEELVTQIGKEFKLDSTRVMPAVALVVQRYLAAGRPHPLFTDNNAERVAERDRAFQYWDAAILKNPSIPEYKSDHPWKPLSNKYGDGYVSEVWIHGRRMAFRTTDLPEDELMSTIRSTATRFNYLVTELHKIYFSDFPYVPHSEVAKVDGRVGLLVDWVDGKEISGQPVDLSAHTSNESFIFTQVFQFAVANTDLRSGKGQIICPKGNLIAFDGDQGFSGPIIECFGPNDVGAVLPDQYTERLVEIIKEIRNTARVRLTPTFARTEIDQLLFRIDVILADIELRNPKILPKTKP